MNLSKLLLPLSLSLTACSAAPKVSSTSINQQICLLKSEALNQVYLNAEPLYGVEACRLHVGLGVTQVLSQLTEVGSIQDNCNLSSSIEEVVDPLLDYSKRSLLHISTVLDDMEQKTFYNVDDRNSFEFAKACFGSISVIRFQYNYFSLDFDIEDVVFEHLRVKLRLIERSVKQSNLLFCTY